MRNRILAVTLVVMVLALTAPGLAFEPVPQQDMVKIGEPIPTAPPVSEEALDQAVKDIRKDIKNYAGSINGIKQEVGNMSHIRIAVENLAASNGNLAKTIKAMNEEKGLKGTIDWIAASLDIQREYNNQAVNGIYANFQTNYDNDVQSFRILVIIIIAGFLIVIALCGTLLSKMTSR